MQLPRKRQLIFAESAPASEVAQVGSRAAGSPVTSKDLDVIQGNLRFTQGWFNTIIRQTLGDGFEASLPASEDFNGLLLTLTSQIEYCFQNGFPEWLDNENERYYANRSIVQVAGEVYLALRGNDTDDINVQENPATSPDYWRLLFSLSNTAFYREVTGPTTIDLSAGNPVHFIEVTGGTPFTLVLNGFTRPAGSPLTVYNNTAAELTIDGSSGLTDTVDPAGVLSAASSDSQMVRQISVSPAGNQLLRQRTASSLDSLLDLIWTRRQTLDSSVTALTSGNNFFIAGTTGLGVGNSVWASPDGITWTERQTLDGGVQALTFGNNLFVAGTGGGGADSIWTSVDTITWTQQQQLGISVGALTFGNNTFVAGTFGGAPASTMWSSPDGITWTLRQLLDGDIESVTFGNNLFVAGTDANTVWTSPDGIVWTQQQTLDGRVASLTFGNNAFVAGTGGAGDSVWTSPDGITWTEQQTLDSDIESIVFGNEIFNAGTLSGTVWSSPDAIVWTRRQSLATVSSMTFGNDSFVAGTSGTNNQAVWSTLR